MSERYFLAAFSGMTSAVAASAGVTGANGSGRSLPRRFLLWDPVAVDIEGQGERAVAQPFRYLHEVDALRKLKGREGMTEVVEPYAFDRRDRRAVL